MRARSLARSLALALASLVSAAACADPAGPSASASGGPAMQFAAPGGSSTAGADDKGSCNPADNTAGTRKHCNGGSKSNQ